jgi:hypothetical protein
MDDFIKAYVENPGNYTFKEAVDLAIERDEAANVEFLASLNNR